MNSLIYFQNLMELCALSSADSIFSEPKSQSGLSGYIWLKDAFTPPRMNYALHTLYLGSDTDLFHYSLTPPPNMHFLIFSCHTASQIASRIPSAVNLIVLPPEQERSTCSKIYSLFGEDTYTGQFAEDMLSSLFYESGIQAMIDKAYTVLGNPIFVFDAGYNLIAANRMEGARHGQGKKIIENGGFRKEEFEMVNHLEHIHEKVKRSRLPLLAHHPEVGFDQLLCSINPEKDLGHIVVTGLNRPFTETDMKLLLILRQAIDQQMKKNSFIRKNKGIYCEYFLKDLLDEKITTEKQCRERIRHMDEDFSGNMYCLVIETIRSSGTLNTMHIRNLFENRFPHARSLFYENNIVIILSLPANRELDKQARRNLTKICQDNDLYGGLSNFFQNILHLPAYYRQAQCAVSLGTHTSNTPSLFFYQDFYLQHIQESFCPKESLSTFFHPKLKLLLDYDKKNDSQLAESLYMYLAHERNISAASAAMFIHRNTLIYRLKKIDSIVSIDYDNYRERQYLILSYELYIR